MNTHKLNLLNHARRVAHGATDLHVIFERLNKRNASWLEGLMQKIAERYEFYGDDSKKDLEELATIIANYQVYTKNMKGLNE